MASPLPTAKAAVWRYLVVPLPALSLVFLFAWASGALSPARLTPAKFIHQMEVNDGTHAGFRRNHARGLCVTGYFQASGDAADLAPTSILAASTRSQVLGRLSLPGGDPAASDQQARLLSIALQLTAPDGQEWRTAMLSSPVFLVSSPGAFLAHLRAKSPDPTSGKPDPEKLRAFFADHPESAPFLAWIRQVTPPASFASTRYNSLNSFRVRDRLGDSRFVRWSLMNAMAEAASAPEEKSPAGTLFDEFAARVAKAPVAWQWQFQVAGDGDPIADATQKWPDSRPTIEAGQLVITDTQADTAGPCRDINFDPVVLPDGFSPSSDPLLSTRSAAYAESTRRRLQERPWH